MDGFSLFLQENMTQIPLDLNTYYYSTHVQKQTKEL